MFSKLLETGEMPDGWRAGNAVAMASSYMHVPVICIWCKLIEHIVIGRIVQFLEGNKLHMYGVRGSTPHWFKSFLPHCSQCLVMEGARIVKTCLIHLGFYNVSYEDPFSFLHSSMICLRVSSPVLEYWQMTPLSTSSSKHRRTITSHSRTCTA